MSGAVTVHPPEKIEQTFTLHAEGHTREHIARVTGISRDRQRVYAHTFDPDLPLCTVQRFSLTPLAARLGRRYRHLLDDPNLDAQTLLSEDTGLSATDVKLCLWPGTAETVNWATADRYAVAFGLHPSEVWDDWND